MDFKTLSLTDNDLKLLSWIFFKYRKDLDYDGLLKGADGCDLILKFIDAHFSLSKANKQCSTTVALTETEFNKVKKIINDCYYQERAQGSEILENGLYGSIIKIYKIANEVKL